MPNVVPTVDGPDTHFPAWSVDLYLNSQPIPAEPVNYSLKKKAKSRNFFVYEEYLTKTINQLVANKDAYQKTPEEAFVAVEWENEYTGGTDVEDIPEIFGWNFHEEGSLRFYGIEYVSDGPVPLEKVPQHLKVLQKCLETSFALSAFTSSIRTSVHVHFDVSLMTILNVVNFAAVYWLVEDFLSDFCGEARKGNLFCLRSRDAESVYYSLASALSIHCWPEADIFQNSMRYASVNLSAVRKFGSLEFRLMRGTTSFGDIQLWIDALEEVRQFSLKFKDPLQLRKYLFDNPAEDLLRAVFVNTLDRLRTSGKSLSEYTAGIRDVHLSLTPVLTAHKSYDFTERIRSEKERLEKEYEEALAKQALQDTLKPFQYSALEIEQDYAGDINTVISQIQPMEDF